MLYFPKDVFERSRESEESKMIVELVDKFISKVHEEREKILEANDVRGKLDRMERFKIYLGKDYTGCVDWYAVDGLEDYRYMFE